MVMKDKILIPHKIAKFQHGYFGLEIEWTNPFDSISILEITDINNKLVHKSYLKNNTVIFGIEEHLKQSYSVEITNIATKEIILYSIANER